MYYREGKEGNLGNNGGIIVNKMTREALTGAVTPANSFTHNICCVPLETEGALEGAASSR